jgi:hypothetical protein
MEVGLMIQEEHVARSIENRVAMPLGSIAEAYIV